MGHKLKNLTSFLSLSLALRSCMLVEFFRMIYDCGNGVTVLPKNKKIPRMYICGCVWGCI